MVPIKSIEQAERVVSPLSEEMTQALDLWHDLYLDKAPWLKEATVKSLNLPAFICAEIARQITLELKWDITGPADEDGNIMESPRAAFLKEEFAKVFVDLRGKLEQGCGAGGLTLKPYPKGLHFGFDWTTAWEFLPLSFGDEGDLQDVIFREGYQEGKVYYTRLERHTVKGTGIVVTQRAFKSLNANCIGEEIPLDTVPIWAELQPETEVADTEGLLFGWYKVAAANSVDINSPMGASVFARAVNTIREADLQYSRLLWEFEGSELAVDVDPAALRPRKDGAKGPDGRPRMETPQLNERLFRGVDLGVDETYHVFSPAIRDNNIIHGLNQLFARIEDQCGLARGTICDADTVAKTATELKIVKQRSYATVADNQAALERCLRNVIRAMDKYATLYGMAPEGEYQVSFAWDDSILTDTEQQMNERLVLVSSGLMGKAEFREWYFSETKEQAQAAIQAIQEEQLNAQALAQMLLEPQGGPDEGDNPPGEKSPGDK